VAEQQVEVSHEAVVFLKHWPEVIMHFASHTLVGEAVQKSFLYVGDNDIKKSATSALMMVDVRGTEQRRNISLIFSLMIFD
jgi:UDP-glucose 4-epimerase